MEVEAAWRDIPVDILMAILKRLPIKALGRFRCVSKQWLRLLTKNTYFPRLHLQFFKSTEPQSSLLVIRKHNSQFSHFYFAPDNQLDKAAEIKLPFPSSCSSTHVEYTVIGVSDGLVCLTDDSLVYLWNPITNAHTAFPCPQIPKPIESEDIDIVYGFGFDKRHDDYKVIRIISTSDSSHIDSHYSVYTIGTPTWRTLHGKSYYFPSDCQNEYPPTINGEIFWIGSEHRSEVEDLILSFDLSEETFSIIPQPHPTYTNWSDYIRVGEFNGSLCVFNIFLYRGVDIWIHGGDGFWTKTFSIRKSMVKGTVFSMNPLNGSSNRGVVIKQCYRTFYLFSPTTNSMKKLPKCPFETSNAYTLIGSLISPRKIERAKRKRTRDECLKSKKEWHSVATIPVSHYMI